MNSLKTTIYSLILGIAFYSTFANAQCSFSNDWYIPASNSSQNDRHFLSSIPASGFVLLGEHHANTAHHEWQLKIIQHLYEKEKNMVIGLEMLPRASQKALDDWVAGKLNKDQFVQQSGWLEYWSFNVNDYMPILDYARRHKIPLIALNVSHELLQGIKQVGWQAIPESHREGVGDPAKPPRDYVKKLAKSFARHSTADQPLDKQAFLHFLQQQLTWDRAMAEALSQSAKTSNKQLIVGLMGSWHVIDKQGVPHQLNDLGHNNVTTLVPWSEHIDCESVTPGFADAIFGLKMTTLD